MIILLLLSLYCPPAAQLRPRDGDDDIIIIIIAAAVSPVRDPVAAPQSARVGAFDLSELFMAVNALLRSSIRLNQVNDKI